MLAAAASQVKSEPASASAESVRIRQVKAANILALVRHGGLGRAHTSRGTVPSKTLQLHHLTPCFVNTRFSPRSTRALCQST